ncbi:MAG: adenosylcobalamin-dependent ribonucleoside-diphosphate reductase [Candidatus Aquicultorales bacterium]
MKVGSIVKRDKRVVAFDRVKIETAILKALRSVGRDEPPLAARLADEVVSRVERVYTEERPPTVEEVQDIVERVLIDEDLVEPAKAYILYRARRADVRAAKQFVGITKDDLKVGINAAKVLNQRYLIKDEDGRVVETPSQLFRRVARTLAEPDRRYDPEADIGTVEEEFYQLMASFDFMPNSPTLMNAGTPLGQLAACFVIPVEDSITGIFDAVKWMAQIHQSGGGTGFSFARLRPKGDIVRSTKGIASGPVSFMRVFDTATDVIKQGGRRRGANMGILRCDHPDIMEFVTAKRVEGFLANFNVSVAATDEFMKKAIEGGEIDLVNPRTGGKVGKISAPYLFDAIVSSAWTTGDPGLFFIDRANAANPTPNVGKFESTNPCGEVPLIPFESCNLGSINLSKMVKECAGTTSCQIDWGHLKRTVHVSTHLLDNVIDMSIYPLPQIDAITKANRKIGLGVMGFAEMLFKLGIAFDSDEAVKKGEEVMSFIYEEAKEASVKLAEKRGSFPNFPGSKWERAGYKKMRNATVTTIAPTGTIGIIAGTSSGIEPIFAISYARQMMEGATLLETNAIFEEVAKERGFYSRELMLDIAKTGTIAEREDIPEDVKRLFVTAFDIAPEWHVKIQAAFQKYTDNAVSKTVNLPQSAGIEEVRRIYLMAYDMGCKGITIYRYGSKAEQVLYVGTPEEQRIVERPVTVMSEFSGGCSYDSETRTCHY